MFPLLPVAVRWQRAKLGMTPDPLGKNSSGEAERRRCEDDVVQLWRIVYPDSSVRPVDATRSLDSAKHEAIEIQLRSPSYR